MKKIFTIALMATLATGMYSCRQKQVGEQKFDWIADRFDEIQGVVNLYQALGGGRDMAEEAK